MQRQAEERDRRRAASHVRTHSIEGEHEVAVGECHVRRPIMSSRSTRFCPPRLLSVIAILSIGLIAVAGGCQAAPEAPRSADPTVLVIPSGEYEQAFDAVIAAARDVGFITAVRDLRHGVIQTSPLPASTVFEPWTRDNAGLDTAIESTVNLQRRRALVEFAPIGIADASGSDAPARLTGPDVLGIGDQRSPDLTSVHGEMEMRVWVYLERAHTPGMKRFAWSPAMTTRWRQPDEPVDPDEGVEAISIWTPIARDPALEERIVGEVREALERDRTTPSASAPA